jgi:hypothetical protein
MAAGERKRWPMIAVRLHPVHRGLATLDVIAFALHEVCRPACAPIGQFNRAVIPAWRKPVSGANIRLGMCFIDA